MIEHLVKIGCCGFPVSKAKHFSTFSIVELQQTFYQPPEISLSGPFQSVPTHGMVRYYRLYWHSKNSWE